MDYLKECTSILEGMNERGREFSFTLLESLKDNERLKRETPESRIAELEQIDREKKNEADQKHSSFKTNRETETANFEALRRKVCRASSVPIALVNFVSEVSEWLPSFITWNPERQSAIIETVFTAGYRAGQAEQRSKQAKQKGKATI